MHDHHSHDPYVHDRRVDDHAHPHRHDHGSIATDHPQRHHDATAARAHHVMLDLGDGIGALIVQTGPELIGVEVEISAAGDDDWRQHKQVLLRTMGALQVPTLVYDNLEEGDYTLWIDGVAAARGVRVPGGSITELDWRRSPVSTDAG